MMKFKHGDRIRFTYRHHPEETDEHTGEPYKEILVLHPLWMKKVHGIDMKRLTLAEREVLDAIFDDKISSDIRSGKSPHRFPLVNDIVKRMDPLREVKNPQSFYSKFVKVFLRDKDAYRTYYPHRMVAVSRVSTPGGQQGGAPANPKPLFHKPTQTAAPTVPKVEPGKAPNRLDLIRQRAQQNKDKK